MLEIEARYDLTPDLDGGIDAAGVWRFVSRVHQRRDQLGAGFAVAEPALDELPVMAA